MRVRLFLQLLLGVRMLLILAVGVRYISMCMFMAVLDIAFRMRMGMCNFTM